MNHIIIGPTRGPGEKHQSFSSMLNQNIRAIPLPKFPKRGELPDYVEFNYAGLTLTRREMHKLLDEVTGQSPSDSRRSIPR